MIEINKIHLIDVIEGLRQIDNDSCDVIIVDPPYNIGKDFGNNKDELSLEEYVRWSMTYIMECYRVLKDTGTMYIYGFPEIIQHIGILLPYEQRWLFWHYTNKTVPSLNFWQRSCETIISTWKNRDRRMFNRDDVREDYTDTFLKNAAGKTRKASAGRFSNGEKETVYTAHEGGALPRDVLKVPALAGGAGNKERFILCKDCDLLIKQNEKEEHNGHNLIEHPTQKPLELSRKLIMASMDKSIRNTILIPFCGTGSEVISAIDLEQNFISFEINKDYIDLAEKIIEHRRNS